MNKPKNDKELVVTEIGGMEKRASLITLRDVVVRDLQGTLAIKEIHLEASEILRHLRELQEKEEPSTSEDFESKGEVRKTLFPPPEYILELNARLREASGEVKLPTDRLAGFLYDLMVGHLPTGEVFKMVCESRYPHEHKHDVTYGCAVSCFLDSVQGELSARQWSNLIHAYFNPAVTEILYSNGWLALFAQFLADKLREFGCEAMQDPLVNPWEVRTFSVYADQ